MGNLTDETWDKLYKFGKLEKLQKHETTLEDNFESDSEYAASIVHLWTELHTLQVTGKLNVSNSEWRRRRLKRWVIAKEIEAKCWFPISIALALQANDIYIELIDEKHKSVAWPNPGDRGVSKRDWETQRGTAKRCLRSAVVYFKFWALCAKAQ